MQENLNTNSTEHENPRKFPGKIILIFAVLLILLIGIPFLIYEFSGPRYHSSAGQSITPGVECSIRNKNSFSVSTPYNIEIPRRHYGIILMDNEPFTKTLAEALKTKLMEYNEVEKVTIVPQNTDFSDTQSAPEYFILLQTSTKIEMPPKRMARRNKFLKNRMTSTIQIQGGVNGFAANDFFTPAMLETNPQLGRLNDGKTANFFIDLTAITEALETVFSEDLQKLTADKVVSMSKSDIEKFLKEINNNAISENIVKELTPEYAKMAEPVFPDSVSMKKLYSKNGFRYDNMSVYYTVIPSKGSDILYQDLKRDLMEQYKDDESMQITVFLETKYNSSTAHLYAAVRRNVVNPLQVKERLLKSHEIFPYLETFESILTAEDKNYLLNLEETHQKAPLHEYLKLLEADTNLQRKENSYRQLWTFTAGRLDFVPEDCYDVILSARKSGVVLPEEEVVAFYGAEIPVDTVKNQFEFDSDIDELFMFHINIPAQKDDDPETGTVLGWVKIKLESTDGHSHEGHDHDAHPHDDSETHPPCRIIVTAGEILHPLSTSKKTPAKTHYYTENQPTQWIAFPNFMIKVELGEDHQARVLIRPTHYSEKVPVQLEDLLKTN